MMNLMQLLQARIANDESGAAAVEYGMLVALIAAIIIGTVGILGTDIDKAFQAITDVLPS